MLEIKQLSAGYPNKQVLQQIDMTIPAGKVTAILGPNGCGKSTLLKALCGIIPPESGQILLDDRNILALPPRQLAQKIAYLSQSRQTPELTAQQLVLQGRFPYLSYPRRYRKADHALAQAAMEQMEVWTYRDTLLENLSGGERQKVYIAMALAQETPVILLDEPTTFLDISHQLQLMQMVKGLAQKGKTVLMVIHDLPHALQMADQLVLMQEGRIVAAGTPEELYMSGKINDVFRVKLRRTPTDSGWQYYCQEYCRTAD